MLAKNRYPLAVLLILGCTNAGWSEGDRHPNPLDALTMHRHEKPQPPARRSAGRHYSPLDAMNGRMVVRQRSESPAASTTAHRTPKRPAGHPVRRRSGNNYSHTKRSASGSRVPVDRPTMEPRVDPVSNIPKRSHRSALDILNARPDRSDQTRHETTETEPAAEPKNVIVTEARPVNKAGTKKHAVLRAAPDPEDDITGEALSAIGSESPVAHISRIPLLAVPSYKTTPIAGRTSPQKAHPTAGGKVLFLTFDDGPLKGTANLLRVLKEEDVKATLFCIGRNVVKSPALFHQALSMPNILVANHTYTHANNHYRRFYTGSVQKVLNDINRAQTVIGGAKYLRLAGRNVWRLPHVRRNDWAINGAERGKEMGKYEALANRGYFIYGWDIEWLFSHTTQRPIYSGEEMAQKVNLQYHSGHTAKKGKVILLAHDFMWRSPVNARQLRTFIRIMKAQGWTFETIDRYSDTTPAVYVRKHPPGPAHSESAVALAKTSEKSARRTSRNGRRVGVRPDSSVPPAPGTITLVTPAELSMQLTRAIRKQQLTRVRRLLAQGARINARNAAGDIPLNLAIKTNNAVLVRMLVERGANIFSVDSHGMSPMGVAREHHNTVIIQYLIKQIAKQKEHHLHKTPFSMEA